MGTHRETELIALIERLADDSGSQALSVGIGDDTAVLQSPPEGHQLLATTDQVVENTHFVAGRHPPDALGHKLLARGLSDIAAMGGTPSWFLLSLAIPRGYDNEWVKCFAEGLLSARKKIGVSDLPLAGGDIAGSECFMGHIAVVGSIPTGQALVRSGARPGDQVYVSGELGGSALGLERLSNGSVDDLAVTRHLWPYPRLGLGNFLRELGATAAIDISDGLSTELQHMATAGRVAIEINFEMVPRFAGAKDEQLLHGGEEYELLFTAPPSASIPNEWDGLPLTRIGMVLDGSGVELIRDGIAAPLPAGGYEHLRDS